MAVLNRDGYRCVPCSAPIQGERGMTWALHHRKGRSIPDAHQPQNLITVCGASNVDGCHGRIHGNRSEAQDNGWSISRNTSLNPLDVAVLVGGETRYVYLTNEATYAEHPPERGVA
jgi:hypothetical protein